jgi:hypothetical protein
MTPDRTDELEVQIGAEVARLHASGLRPCVVCIMPDCPHGAAVHQDLMYTALPAEPFRYGERTVAAVVAVSAAKLAPVLRRHCHLGGDLAASVLRDPEVPGAEFLVTLLDRGIGYTGFTREGKSLVTGGFAFIGGREDPADQSAIDRAFAAYMQTHVQAAQEKGWTRPAFALCPWGCQPAQTVFERTMGFALTQAPPGKERFSPMACADSPEMARILTECCGAVGAGAAKKLLDESISADYFILVIHPDHIQLAGFKNDGSPVTREDIDTKFRWN